MAYNQLAFEINVYKNGTIIRFASTSLIQPVGLCSNVSMGGAQWARKKRIIRDFVVKSLSNNKPIANYQFDGRQSEYKNYGMTNVTIEHLSIFIWTGKKQ